MGRPGYLPDGDAHRPPYPGLVPSTPPSGPNASELSTADRRAGRLVAAGGVVFLAGLLALGIALALWARQGSAPGLLAALALLCPVGFAVAFAGLVVQARAGRSARG
jgi:ABC-type transport system involved in cytochrome c biogenesis permease subunit